ncbi:uncharacterized protein LOC133798657 [Humulus lupulus]|uniref:uncharacterized protein LOC133798657 n=1 Tax=Humulus lupulus TaxID=3486 RepID=UPI002B403391|nr:uncharacterized protein LOC133798657 [Humulus lupulus]
MGLFTINKEEYRPFECRLVFIVIFTTCGRKFLSIAEPLQKIASCRLKSGNIRIQIVWHILHLLVSVLHSVGNNLCGRKLSYLKWAMEEIQSLQQWKSSVPGHYGRKLRSLPNLKNYQAFVVAGSYWCKAYLPLGCRRMQ